MKYTVVIEEGPTSFGAYVPDLPGCVAVADTKGRSLPDSSEKRLSPTLKVLAEDGVPAPEPKSSAQLVEV